MNKIRHLKLKKSKQFLNKKHKSTSKLLFLNLLKIPQLIILKITILHKHNLCNNRVNKYRKFLNNSK